MFGVQCKNSVKFSPGEGSVNGLSKGFLVLDPLLLQQPLPTQVFPMILTKLNQIDFRHDSENQGTFLAAKAVSVKISRQMTTGLQWWQQLSQQKEGGC